MGLMQRQDLWCIYNGGEYLINDNEIIWERIRAQGLVSPVFSLQLNTHFRPSYPKPCRLLIRLSTRTWKSKLKEWKYDKYSTGKDKSIVISNVEEGERAEERITVTYPLQYDRFLTLKNDWSLFFVAHSASLVRISVSNVPDEWKGEDMAEFPLICLANALQLHQNTISVSSDCFIAKNPEDERRCDAFHCGKKISGLYFREFSIKKTLHLAYFPLRLLWL